jgi:hypothetical protein
LPDRHLPVRPRLAELERQAEELLRGTGGADLAAAQEALARSYGVESWPRLVLACRLIDAIWRDDVEEVRRLVTEHPRLLHEMARGTRTCNWGPPMSYAANLGRERIIAMLRELGAEDLQHAFDRACLQSRISTARQLHAMGARPEPDAVMGPAETQSASGLAFLLELGAPISDRHGDRLAPVALLLETYCRNVEGKHRCLELFLEHGIALPDTAPMAVHRGRTDLLEKAVSRDPGLLDRAFPHEEFFPPELGCHADHSLALCGTPITGGTLLHLAVEYDEIEIARWLIAKGAGADRRAQVDGDGFGGHTALFGCVVSQTYCSGRRKDDAFARLLLDGGADPNVRVSLRKQLRDAADNAMHEYRDVTPLSWGERFVDQAFVNRDVMRLIAERGGRP